ncbi:hypothetical protein, partial [Paraclostridium bifermentans]|uniref:hypothetical protein n=1 Tax=Paraclostridium bifermentans TaxID=1490 RepID=UPI00359CB597
MLNQNHSPSQTLPLEAKYFKEEIINEILEIPKEKPDIENILNTLVWPEIESFKIIETEKGISNEGQNLTGFKLLVKVKLNEKITYVADHCSQPVHAAHFESVKTMFVVLPEMIDGEKTCVLLNKGKLSIMPYIECVEA